jgi:general secretion pathway protein N
MTQRRPSKTPPPAGRRVLGFALLAGALAGLCAFAPARWLALGLEQATRGVVRLPNASGTVWQGHADLLLSAGQGSSGAQALPHGLRWTVRPGWGSQGPDLTLALQAPCCTAQAMTWRLVWAPGGPQFSLAPHTSEWPAQWLTGLGAPWNTLGLEGQLQLRSNGLALQPRAGGITVTGALTIEAQDLSTSLSTLRPLGSYRFELSSSSDHALALRLDTLRGDLRLNGSGEWLQGRLRFRGLAEASPDHVDALSNLLNILGRRDGPRAHMSLG